MSLSILWRPEAAKAFVKFWRALDLHGLELSRREVYFKEIETSAFKTVYTTWPPYPPSQ